WHAVLRSAGGLDEDPLLSAITHLTISGLVVEDASSGEVLYRVTHPMVQEVAYAELSTRARQRMHKAVANALEEMGSTDVERLAVHYRAAGSEVDPDRAVDVLVAAGERARSRYAHDEVARNLGAALTLIRAGHRPELLPTVLEQLGEAQVSVGERDGGRRCGGRRLSCSAKRITTTLSRAFTGSWPLQNGTAAGSTKHISTSRRVSSCLAGTGPPTALPTSCTSDSSSVSGGGTTPERLMPPSSCSSSPDN